MAHRDRLEQELRRKISGEILFDEVSRLVFSTDASIYQIKPLGVVFPRSRDDIVQTIRTAAKYRVPILPRGGGTSLAGQTVSPGLVVDCSKHLTRVLEVNPARRWARVEPGVVLDNLNDFLRFYGLFFAPDVATSSRATIGGMLGNNSAGVRSIRYGKTVDHVREISAILSTGEQLTFSRLNARQLAAKICQRDREGALYREVRALVEDNRDEIRRRFPKVMRRVGGYNLDYLLDPERFNLSHLMVGSEGTLAFVAEAKLNLEPIPAARAVAVAHFDDLIKAIDAVEIIVRRRPSAVEIIDPHAIRLARDNPTVSRLFASFTQGDPQALLIVEFAGDSEDGVRASLSALRADPALNRLAYHVYEGWEKAQQAVVWQVRKHTLGVLLSLRGDAKPLPFIEDVCVPVQRLSSYIRRVLKICRKHGREAAMYAHASVGVIHVRPILNLKREEDVRIMQAISEETFALTLEYGGAWSGEHGDGLVRSYKNPEFFGETLFSAFRKVKQIFDPLGVMNPGKIVDTPDMTENLRIHPLYKTRLPETFFRFERDRGLAGAVEMCTGVGHCRKTLDGTMCPSYMATRDEEHSTRGRANALRSAMAGDLGPDGFTSRRLYEVLDLCLECKACKSECPSNVDMARIKAEFLAHYYERHGLPLGKRLLSRARESAEWAARFPSLANFLLGNAAAKWALERFAGIDRRRRLPVYAPRTLSAILKKRAVPDDDRPAVAFFVDTFVNFYEPQVGLAAIALLERLGFRVETVDSVCCGRPLISAGRLGQARRRGLEAMKALERSAREERPIIFLEPSCLSTLKDDAPDLVEDVALSRLAASRMLSLEEFLASDTVFPKLLDIVGQGPPSVLLHGHCQQKALSGTEAALKALSALKNAAVREVDAGCCGMAGAFGYEKEHYGLSQKLGARRLFPAVNKTDRDCVIVASGFSCRSQIRHFTKRRALHLAEVLFDSLNSED